MKVLIVCSGNSKFIISPFVKEQGESLKNAGISLDYFLIKGKGIIGYLKNLPILKKQIKKNKYNLIHAHYGLSGLLCVLQRKIPVIITFHGSDINNLYHRNFSKIAMRFTSFNVFVHKSIKEKVNSRSNYAIIPCGVNLQRFYFMERDKCRQRMGFKKNKKYILFSSSFDNQIKNYTLAKRSLLYLDDNYKLIELKGYSRDEVNILINAADVALMTSLDEGSPQFIKEAMSCNCPIVSTDVGDVKEIIGNTKGCYITSYDPEDVAEKIKLALEFGKMTNGRERVIKLDLDSNAIANKIVYIYKKVIDTNKDFILNTSRL